MKLDSVEKNNSTGLTSGMVFLGSGAFRTKNLRPKKIEVGEF